MIQEEANKTKTTTVATAILYKEGKVLVLKRSAAHELLPGYWQFPEGKLESGEKPEEALIREVLEETGLEINKNKFLKSYPVIVPYKNIAYEVTRLVYLAEFTGKISLSEEHDEYAWIDPQSSAKDNRLYAGIKEILNDLTTNPPNLPIQA